MKLYGYKEADLEVDEPAPSKLVEVTLVASPAELRKIAAFLESAAREMERMGEGYSHEHLSDKDRSFSEAPQFIVAPEVENGSR
jgi:hypothetical protein